MVAAAADAQKKKPANTHRLSALIKTKVEKEDEITWEIRERTSLNDVLSVQSF